MGEWNLKKVISEKSTVEKHLFFYGGFGEFFPVFCGIITKTNTI